MVFTNYNFAIGLKNELKEMLSHSAIKRQLISFQVSIPNEIKIRSLLEFADEHGVLTVVKDPEEFSNIREETSYSQVITQDALKELKYKYKEPVVLGCGVDKDYVEALGFDILTGYAERI